MTVGGVDVSESLMIDCQDIPIFIISYNRYGCLKKIVERLHDDGYNNVIIVDNASTDKELLDYLNDNSHLYKVVSLKKNYGHRVVWECGLFDEVIKNEYYVVTDPDIIPIDECPNDYIQKFYELLIKYPQYTKAGFSLMLSDLPASYKYRTDIWRWESFFWENQVENKDAYIAELDTTFALYRPAKDLNLRWYEENFYSALRTEKPYVARHLSWYIDSSQEMKDDGYFQGNEIQTSLNENAMESFNVEVIHKLYLKSKVDLYEILKRIHGENEKSMSFKNVLKSCWLLLRVKLFK